MLIHGFSKNEQVARQLVDNGFYLSFGKYLLQSRSLGTELESVFKNVPNNRFFLETDTIEEGIYEVYALAAKYKNLNEKELQFIIVPWKTCNILCNRISIRYLQITKLSNNQIYYNGSMDRKSRTFI